MRRLIDDFVRRTGFSVVLDRKVISGIVDVFYYNFIGNDGRFYSLLVPCNETQILLEPRKHLAVSEFLDGCNGCEHTDLLISQNLRIFDHKEDWLKGKWQLEEAKAVDKRMREYLGECLVDRCEVDGCRLVSYRLWLRPAVGLSVLYEEAGRGIKSFSVWHGCKTELLWSSKLKSFVEELGLEKHVEWIGECNDVAGCCEE